VVLVAVAAARMQNQAQQLVSLPEAWPMQTSLRHLRMDQLLIVGSTTAQTLRQQQHLKVFWQTEQMLVVAAYPLLP
jgi:hypothetical protein